MMHQAKAERAIPLAGRRVAIIEDDLTTARVAESICRRLGARETVVCRDGADAARCFVDRSAPVDVVLLDMMLGADDGLAAMRCLDPATTRAAIVPFSAKDGRILEAAMLLLATRGFRVHEPIAKPLTAEKLGQVLRRAAFSAPGLEPAVAQPPEAELKAALAADEYLPFYQFKCDTRTLRPRGVEVLARWQHPERGLVSPAGFIPGLEQANLIASATERLLARALTDLALLGPQAGALDLALNIYAPMLANPALPDRLEAIVQALHVPPSRVTFEIAESAALEDPLALLEGSARLRLHGFRLAVDDFGMGWSSLDMLRTLPFTELKIDRRFVSGAPSDPARQQILRGAVAMAQGLGLDIVGKGVETEAERALLAELGVPVIQGWLTGKPLSRTDLAGKLAAGTLVPGHCTVVRQETAP